MFPSELLTYSKKMHSVADQILDSSNLLKILEKYGEVLLHGSYPLDVMYGPDIDIVVASKDIQVSSRKALDEILDLSYFQKVEYGDFVKFPRANRPNGYILVLKTTIEEIKWEVEVWFLENIQSEKTNFEFLRDKISEDNRIKILEAKQERETQGITKHKLSSHELYKKVLSE